VFVKPLFTNLAETAATGFGRQKSAGSAAFWNKPYFDGTNIEKLLQSECNKPEK